MNKLEPGKSPAEQGNKKYLQWFLNDWELVQTVNWNNLEQYNNTLAEYIAYKVDDLGRRTEAFLRVVEE